MSGVRLAGEAEPGGGGSLRVIELQLVSFIMVFSASGRLVPLLDLLFPAFTTAYILLLSRLAFPTRSGGGVRGDIFAGGRLFRAYVVAGNILALFLPLAYVLGAFARGDNHAVRSATPHLFLLSSQILTEHIIAGFSLFSPPVRALVPLLYTVRRIYVLIDWLPRVWITGTPSPANAQYVAWCWFGRSLAVANLVYFTLNLLCFLIPRFLPNAFHKYFWEKERETLSKMAQDNPYSKKTD